MENMNTSDIMKLLETLKKRGVDLNNINENTIESALSNIISNTKLNTKMNWLVNALLTNNDERTKIVKDVNENMKLQNFGIIRAPTGIGKSGIIYTDMYNRIIKNNNVKKQVFIISTPLLCLNDQFFNDMISTLFCANIINNKNCVIANNSCDFELKKGTFEIIAKNGDNFDTKIPMMSVDDACLELGKPETKIALIVSTHKSFNKMYLSLNDVKKQYKDAIEIGAYMDEEHTIKFCVDDNNILDDDEIDEEKTLGVINIKSFSSIFSFFYVASATPRESHVDLMKMMFPTPTSHFVADISAIEAIKSKDILPPHATFCTVNDKKNVKEIEVIIKHIFDENMNTKKDTHVPFVKVLVNCETTEDLKKLCDYLVSKNYKIFYTTSATGKHYIDSNGDKELNSLSDFTNEINNIKENVVVLHIRQCIAGIDISGLTHCIIRGVLHGTNDVVRAIQTIGRTLRYYENERILIQKNPKYKLKKKYGGVYFVVNNDIEAEENYKLFEKFMYMHYGVGITNCFDIKDHKITGNHRLERLNTDSFTKTPKSTSVNVSYEEYFLNNDFVKLLIKQKVSPANIEAVINKINENFIAQYKNDGFYTTEYMSVLKGYTNKLNDVLDEIKKAMHKK